MEWSGVAARTRDARSVLQNETLEVAIGPEGQLHHRQLLDPVDLPHLAIGLIPLV